MLKEDDIKELGERYGERINKSRWGQQWQTGTATRQNTVPCRSVIGVLKSIQILYRIYKIEKLYR